MAVSSVRFELERGGVGELLASSEMQKLLDAKANAVADAARARGVMVEGDQVALPVKAESRPTSTRARARVVLDHPAGLAVEAKHRLLVGSLDAARNA